MITDSLLQQNEQFKSELETARALLARRHVRIRLDTGDSGDDLCECGGPHADDCEGLAFLERGQTIKIQERDEMLRNEGREEVFARLDGLARERLVEKLREHFDTTDYEDRTFAQLKAMEGFANQLAAKLHYFYFTCGYCGDEIQVGDLLEIGIDEAINRRSGALLEHAAECEKHPVVALTKDLATANAHIADMQHTLTERTGVDLGE